MIITYHTWLKWDHVKWDHVSQLSICSLWVHKTCNIVNNSEVRHHYLTKWYHIHQCTLSMRNHYQLTSNDTTQVQYFSSVASPICQEGQSERTFPILALSSWFFLFSIFSRFFLSFPDFSQFLTIFSQSRGHSVPFPLYWLRHCNTF